MPSIEQLKMLFIAARQLPKGDRQSFLISQCAGDLQQQREVEALLELADQDSHFVLKSGLPLQSGAVSLASATAETIEHSRARPSLEGYEVVGYLGAGAMGIVWKAIQLSVGRPVALKVIRPGILHSEKARLRFTREVKTAGSLEHPNIARVYDSGLQHAIHYCVMELIDGLPLDQYVRAHSLQANQILSLIETICRAIGYAHQKGVIHRDLKPSNILVSADGQPHVLDFGLAKSLRDADDNNASIEASTEGEVAGTLGFMSPEQASGKHKELDGRTDVYSLGVILYRLIVGQPPVDLSCTWLEALRRIAEAEPQRPTELNRGIDASLEAMLLKSVARDPAARYATSSEMALAISQYVTTIAAAAATTTASTSLRIVIVHRRTAQLDQYVLRLLESALAAAGHQVFVDRQLTIGTEWARLIEQEIRSADAIIPILSRDSVQSEMVAYEVQVACQAAQGHRGKPRIFPVRVAYEGPLGGELAGFLDGLHYVLWRGIDDDRKLLDQLLPALSAPPRLRTIERAKLESVGGAVPLDSKFYVVRSSDELAADAIRRRDSILLIKGARQMGKTSLLAQSLKVARDDGARVVLTDLQKLTVEEMGTLESFYKAIGTQLSDQLDLETSPQDVWKAFRGPNANFERYFRREVLEKSDRNILWALDEADRLFSHNYSGSVFGLFRTWHNERALDPSGPWSRLTLAIAYATEAHLFISDLNQSPFNVGTRLALEDFTLDQVADLNRRHGSLLTEGSEVATFYRLVGGQPYLVRRGLSEIASTGMSIDDFASRADQENGPYGDHLRRMLAVLSKDRELAETVRSILRGGSCPNSEVYYHLSSGGILTGTSRDECRMRCEVYAKYLRRHLL